MCAYMDPSGGARGRARSRSPTRWPSRRRRVPREAARRGRRDGRGADGALPRAARSSPPEDVAAALKDAVTSDELYPVACGVATKNLGTHALLDLLVEGVPSPARKPSPIELGDASTAAFVFKTIADPFAGRIIVLPRARGRRLGRLDARRTRATTRRSGSGRLLVDAGQGHETGGRARRRRPRRRREAEGRA